jgi:hypothetical protein
MCRPTRASSPTPKSTNALPCPHAGVVEDISSVVRLLEAQPISSHGPAGPLASDDRFFVRRACCLGADRPRFLADGFRAPRHHEISRQRRGYIVGVAHRKWPRSTPSMTPAHGRVMRMSNWNSCRAATRAVPHDKTRHVGAIRPFAPVSTAPKSYSLRSD